MYTYRYRYRKEQENRQNPSHFQFRNFSPVSIFSISTSFYTPSSIWNLENPPYFLSRFSLSRLPIWVGVTNPQHCCGVSGTYWNLCINFILPLPNFSSDSSTQQLIY